MAAGEPKYLTQDHVEREARALARGAERTLDVASPWAEPYPLERLLGEVLPRVRAGELRVRLVYRVAEESDLQISDLSALEALAYVRESFEAAGEIFLDDLPHLDTGVCICAGTMVAMPVRCDVPLFAPRRRFELGPVELPAREALERAVAAVLPEAALVADADELVVFAGPEAEVTVRAGDGGYALDVDCEDGDLAERVRAAVEAVLATPAQERS